MDEINLLNNVDISTLELILAKKSEAQPGNQQPCISLVAEEIQREQKGKGREEDSIASLAISK